MTIRHSQQFLLKTFIIEQKLRADTLGDIRRIMRQVQDNPRRVSVVGLIVPCQRASPVFS
jgi:hypothetical protein